MNTHPEVSEGADMVRKTYISSFQKPIFRVFKNRGTFKHRGHDSIPETLTSPMNATGLGLRSHPMHH